MTNLKTLNPSKVMTTHLQLPVHGLQLLLLLEQGGLQRVGLVNLLLQLGHNLGSQGLRSLDALVDHRAGHHAHRARGKLQGLQGLIQVVLRVGHRDYQGGLGVAPQGLLQARRAWTCLARC